MLLKELPHNEKPRERLALYGVEALTNEELIAILLRSGTKSISVKELAMEVLKKINTIDELDKLTLIKLLKIKGIGKSKAMSIIAALELGKRVYLLNKKTEKIKIVNGKIVYNLYKFLYRIEKQENLIVVLVDNKNNIIDSKTIFKGTINSSIAHPREIFNYAILNSATAIIILHNHPSGDPTPSMQDIDFTNKLFKCGEIIGIPVIDHIIIGNNKYYTFKENKVVIE